MTDRLRAAWERLPLGVRVPLGLWVLGIASVAYLAGSYGLHLPWWAYPASGALVAAGAIGVLEIGVRLRWRRERREAEARRRKAVDDEAWRIVREWRALGAWVKASPTKGGVLGRMATGPGWVIDAVMAPVGIPLEPVEDLGTGVRRCGAALVVLSPSGTRVLIDARTLPPLSEHEEVTNEWVSLHELGATPTAANGTST